MEKGNKSNVIFMIILMFQIAILIYFGTLKKEIDLDEIYSYSLANSYEIDKIENSNDMWENWIGGNEFYDMLTVKNGEQFAYNKTYYNNSLDNSPPFYYFLIHTICSLFPGDFSIWYGLILNFIFFVLNQCVLYKLSQKIFGKSLWCLLPVVVYGGTYAMIDTALNIRMYMLLTLFSTLLFYCIYKMLFKDNSIKDYLICGLITFLGVFTHWYFGIYAFYLTVFYVLFRIYEYIKYKKKDSIREMIKFGIAMLLGVAVVFVVYPIGFHHISKIVADTNGYVAIENFGMKDWFNNIYRFSADLKNVVLMGIARYVFVTIALLTIFIICSIVLAKTKTVQNKDSDDASERLYLFIAISLIILCDIVTISRVAGKFNYIRYMYNIVPVCCLDIVLFIRFVCTKIKINNRIIASGIFVLGIYALFVLAFSKMCYHLGGEQGFLKSDIVKEIASDNLIVIGDGTYATTYLDVLYQSKNVYLTEKVERLDELVDDSTTDISILLSDRCSEQDKNLANSIIESYNYNSIMYGNNILYKIKKSNRTNDIEAE